MKRALSLLLLYALLGVPGALFAEPNASTSHGKIIVHVTGFPNDKGHARIGLFNHAQGFPMDSAQALTGARVAIEKQEATAVFDNLPYGTYAVIAHHDANDNYQIDKNWLGKPVEMYGASNNPRARLRAPRFAESSFKLNTDSVVVHITLHH